MKTNRLARCAWIIASAAAATVSLMGQGTVRFDNRVQGVLDAPMFESDGTTRLDNRFVAQMYVVQGGSAFAVSPQVPFRTGVSAGYFFGGDVAVPGVAPGQNVTIEVRFWEAAFGTFD